MMNLIEGLPDNVLGFEVTGTVTGKDYEDILVPAVERQLAESDKIRLLYHLGGGFEKFDLGAMWEDAKVGLQHLTAWEKIAVVTDVDWVCSSVKVFGFALPAEVRTFSNDGLEEAKDWLSE